jgi:hypothetical protein
LAKQAAKIKISNKLNSVADTAFLKKKMEKGAKTLAVAVCLSKYLHKHFYNCWQIANAH